MFPGTYFTCYYFPCTYFPGTTTLGVTFRQGIQAGLLASVDVTDVVSSRVFPITVSQLANGVSLAWQVISQVRSRALDKPTGVVAARVRFHARGKILSDCQNAIESVRQALDHFDGEFGGLTVIEALVHDVRDESTDPANATGMMVHSVYADVFMRYREMLPDRFS